MRRYTNWGLVLFVGILTTLALISDLWLPEIQPLLVAEESLEQYSCPSFINDDQCNALAELAVVDAELAEHLVEGLDPSNTLPDPNQPDINQVARNLNENTSDEPVITLVKTGTFSDLDILRTAQGQVMLYEIVAGGQVGRFLRLENEFRVLSAPDLEVFLSTSRNPTTLDEFTNSNPVEVGFLRSNVGNQNFELPTTLDLSPFRSVVIYSAEYNLIYAVAPIFTN
jgi:hypothetical protein